MKLPFNKFIYIRCYSTLNDFIPLVNRGKTFLFHFNGFPTVKDLVEGLGIPHVEIGAILCDGEFVDWSIKVESKSRLSVYPQFVSFPGIPIQLNPKYPNTEKIFVADAHLGKLTRFLRMIGFDTLYSNKFTDSEIISISNDQGRVILTRDKGILFNGNAHWGYFLRSQYPKVQLHEVLSTFGLPIHTKPFSRCIVCNGLIEELPKHIAFQFVEYRIYEYNNCFYQCSNCRKIFWEGSHYKKMRDLISIIEILYKLERNNV